MKNWRQFGGISFLTVLCAVTAQGLNAEAVADVGREEQYAEPESQSFLAEHVLWQDISLSYLYGKGFEVDADEQQTITFEHASGLSFGDTFLFVDFIDYRDTRGEENSIYGEFSPRFSFSKIADVDASFGPIEE